jgi:hypothetical protein
VTDKAILDRIRKCLARANHPNAQEQEAHTAMRMASRLMKQFNITNADLVEEKADCDDLASLGGQSTVTIVRSRDDGKRITHHVWVDSLGSAMVTLFDCKWYTMQRNQSYDITFYGIPTNTVGAAMSFELCYNLILEWARSKDGKVAKSSYCLGMGDGLYRLAISEKEAEDRAAETQEMEEERAAGMRASGVNASKTTGGSGGAKMLRVFVSDEVDDGHEGTCLRLASHQKAVRWGMLTIG